MTVQVMHGSMRTMLAFLGENTFDSIVTDPPYELTQAKRTNPPPYVEGSPFSRHRVGVNGDAKPVGGFMGKEWDGTGVAFDPETWRAALRVLKPGGHMLAFGGTRTYHRMVCAIEDAGFEIRDQIGWVYGSGFPKSRDVSAMDMTGQDADDWDGWGTALKPAWEPIVVARKPLAKGLTVAANMIQFRTGGFNIDATRVHSHDSAAYAYSVKRMAPGADQNRTGKTHQVDVEYEGVTKDGRWPANLIHDGSDEVLAAFPIAPGQLAKASVSDTQRAGQNVYSAMARGPLSLEPRNDTGSAARFFYCAKASKSDREGGNSHPTVKPTELMRHLCRLVTPAGGLVLDPFAGSGSTGKAAALEGFRAMLIEREVEYVQIARARIAKALDT